ncbi:MAG: tyrosine-type recombinase/integrase [Jiangellaceae bacterium]
MYAGIDPVTKKRHELIEHIPSGPKAEGLAEAARVRLVNQVNERRHPRTTATVAQLLERYLGELRVARKTLHTYRGYIDKHVLPYLGNPKVGQVDADTLGSLYAELLRCRDHCDGKAGRTDHRTRRPHDCDDRCTPHTCQPLAEWTVRKIHWILSGAFRRAQRWNWVATNPMTMAEPPSVKPPNPKPPTAQEAAQIIEEAWKDPDWGALIWLTMVTGQRRGELCAIRWRHLDLEHGILHVERRIGQIGGDIWEEESTKTYSDRRIVLDPETVEQLAEHRMRCEARTRALGVELDSETFVFSLDPDGRAPRRPESVSQRYRRMCRRIGITTTIHKLRHYSATELILAGVDIRTVAGRLGHAGGGATTLRTYAAWVSEGDQRAAAHIAARMPKRPTSTRPEVVDVDVKNPYQRIAVDLRDQILVGTLIPGLPIPTIKQLAAAHGVSVPTAKRAVDLLAEWGFVEVISGRRTLVLKSAGDLGQAEATVDDNHPAEAPQALTATSDPKPLVSRVVNDFTV